MKYNAKGIALCILAIVVSHGGLASAAVVGPSAPGVLRIDATMDFSSHSSVFNDGGIIFDPISAAVTSNNLLADPGIGGPGIGGPGGIGPIIGTSFTLVTDRYSLILNDLVVPGGDYTRYEFAISAGPGRRFVTSNSFNSSIEIASFAQWGTGLGIASSTFGGGSDHSFVGGSGTLPNVTQLNAPFLDFFASNTGFVSQFNPPSVIGPTGGFGFEMLIIGRDLSTTEETPTGAFAAAPSAFIEFSYVVIGDAIADPGTFTSIVAAVPEPSSFALLGLGALKFVYRHRSRN